ncbi:MULTISPECIES: heavy metal translocating P-type ATPase [unclassified Schlesneria]|uniref:heavy metal translocating P-type ATPase n=1 Tax=Schlesneria TaxID=656899 RepID=UPI0035A16C62
MTTPPRPDDSHRYDIAIAVLAAISILVHLAIRFGVGTAPTAGPLPIMDWPLVIALVVGGLPLVIGLLGNLVRGQFGSDLLAGLSIMTSLLLGEYLAGTIVVLMLSGGEALEAWAIRSASSVLDALARRMPTKAHRKEADAIVDIAVDQVSVGDVLVLFPHEICPVDGVVLEGRGSMDESFLTGEPYLMPKSAGSTVMSGALNGESALTIRSHKLAVDSRYAQIMKVMQVADENRPRMRRIGDRLGAFYTPLAIAIAAVAWWLSGEVTRFLAVLVIATPCPLLIAIPVAIIGSISLAARRGIIIRDPSVLERIDTCRVAIFDKTGTLTYGRPALTEVICGEGTTEQEALAFIGSIERYSKHPLASAITARAHDKGAATLEVTQVHEPPGQGLVGTVGGRQIRVTSRGKLTKEASDERVARILEQLPPQVAGMECIGLIDETIPVTFRFRDQPRMEGAPFIKHLSPKHRFHKVMIVSGDRESEVRYLAGLIGISEVHFSQTPEQKLALVRNETKQANTVFVGDGINDAPALTSATVGIAMGGASDITSEAAHAVILDSSLSKVDELLHIGQQLRQIVLQSSLGGMLLSIGGMILAAFGLLSPVGGAIAQEVIDLLAVLNALRAARTPRQLTDFNTPSTAREAAASSPR